MEATLRDAWATSKRSAGRTRADAAIEKAAAQYEVSADTLTHHFRLLAVLADRDSRTPKDFLAGRSTPGQSGGIRGGGVPLNRRVRPETIEAVDAAIERLGHGFHGGLDRFLADAAAHVLAGFPLKKSA